MENNQSFFASQAKDIVSGLFLIAAALTIASCGSQSPGLSSGVDGAFIRAAQTWDLNRDGIVTCDEWRNYARKLFKDFDKNKDGKLTSEEFANMAQADRLFEAANFQYFDTGGKGFVSEADFADRPNPAFLALDPDRKCQMTTAFLRSATTDVSAGKPVAAIPTGGGK